MVLSTKTGPEAAPNFNLVDEAWIPVRQNGRHRLASLGELFRTAHEIQDLDCAAHERIALLRLLVCITHAALGAPDSPDEWGDFGAELAVNVPAYLQRPDIKPHFNLLGDGPRFLQVAMAKTKQKPLLEFLELKFANGPAFLDHAVGTPKRVAPERLALNLLCFQNFFIGGGMGSPKNGGVVGNGPSLKFLHTYLIGGCLKETVILNCLLEEYISPSERPVWESGEISPSKILSRLAPQPCNVWLGRTTLMVSQGQEYPMEEGAGESRKLLFRDPFATLVNYKNRIGVLRAEVSKALWRDLHLFLEMRQISRSGEMAAPQNILSHAPALKQTGVTLWAGELIKAKDAVVVDAVESSFTVPSEMLADKGGAIYREGVEFADDLGERLKAAVKAFRECMGAHEKKNSLATKGKPAPKAQSLYWHMLDRESPLLLELVGKPMPLAYAEAGNPWGDLVRRAAREAYEATCPRQTPRQIKAFAAGLKMLSVPRPKMPST